MELILAGVIVALLVFVYIRERAFVEERREFLNAIMSKNSIEFSTANTISKPEKKKNEKQIPDDFIPESSLTDEEFFKAIEKTINKN